jgi:hypothetical protein
MIDSRPEKCVDWQIFAGVSALFTMSETGQIYRKSVL